MNIDEYIFVYFLLICVPTIIVVLHIIAYIKYTKRVNVILFFRPGCPYCDMLIPEWNKFINMTHDKNIIIKEIDIQKCPDIADKFKVSNIPHIIRIQKNKEIVYYGNRTAQDIFNFVNNK